jgi:bifunctional non-homologous end joining protein LigD
MNIFAAAYAGDTETVAACLARGDDPGASDERGFTALHCAAIGSNQTDTFAVIDLLIRAGSPLEALDPDGRTALYLAAELSCKLAPVQRLIEAGAQVDIASAHGTHIVINALLPEVRQWLSELTGKPIPPPPIELPSVKLSTVQWRAVQGHLNRAFHALEQLGIVTMQDAGTTQDDGFSDCSDIFQQRGGIEAGLIGICFYTRQDLNRAKRTSQLSLAFWGAPAGALDDMLHIGRQITQTFAEHGFTLDWNGSASMRPNIFLQDIAAMPESPSGD